MSNPWNDACPIIWKNFNGTQYLALKDPFLSKEKIENLILGNTDFYDCDNSGIVRVIKDALHCGRRSPSMVWEMNFDNPRYIDYMHFRDIVTILLDSNLAIDNKEGANNLINQCTLYTGTAKEDYDHDQKFISPKLAKKDELGISDIINDFKIKLENSPSPRM